MTGNLPELAYFCGPWQATATNPSTGQRFELAYVVEPFLGGTWLRGAGRAEVLGLEIHDLWGKDPVSGELVRTIFDSSGTFGTVRSPGWSGDVLVLEGDATSTAGRVHVRETITRRGPDAFDATWEMQQGDAWVAHSVEELRRVGQ